VSLWRRSVDRFAEATVVLSFSRAGYTLRKGGFRAEDLDVDMSGKVVVVTGANSGIGFSVARDLAARKATVLMVCRSEERGGAARERIVAHAGHDDVHLLRCDVSDLDDVRALAAVIRARTERVDRLVLNAGVLLDDKRHTGAGIETTFATNVLGGFLLTAELLGELRRAASARILHVTSGGMYTQRLDLDLLEGRTERFDGVVAYAQTKRAQVILNELWAERLQGTRVTSFAMHPGWADTPGIERSLPRFHRLLGPVLRDAEQGADTLLWLACAPDLEGHSGELFLDRAPRSTHRMRRTHSDEETRHALWRRCAEVCGLSGELAEVSASGG
jgi:NAD(P)-dependent dehydrogenase (short-subunit alcohol dehydrogenase family)